MRAAHDVSCGGLAIALAEMLLAAPGGRELGIEADLSVLEVETAAALFSERPGIVFAVSPERSSGLFQWAREHALPAWPVGVVRAGAGLRLRLAEGLAEWPAARLREAAARPLERLWNEEPE